VGEGRGEGPTTTSYHGGRHGAPLTDLSRKLRRTSTDAERLLWSKLRAGRLDGAKFRRQHEFGPYILDFFCAKKSLAIELDGSQHTTAAGVESDEARTRYLAGRGVKVLRFTNLEVMRETDAVLQRILEVLLGPSP
jgi:very-short-patch-repair endonuclease